MRDKAVKEIENRLDDEYRHCFPQAISWEKSATHLLIAYDYEVRGADVHTIDRMKYALMHALRWGQTAPSQPFRGYPKDFDPNLFEQCRLVLQRGTEYVGIWGAFTLYHENVVGINKVHQSGIEFTANPSWKAYDILDSQIVWSTPPSLSASSIAALQKAARQLANGFESLKQQEMTDWLPDYETGRTLLRSVGPLLNKVALLPRSWKFDGIPILTLRGFWKTILTLALLHREVAYRLTGPKCVGMIQLLIKPRDVLVDWIAGCAGIEQALVERLVDLHTYDRSLSPPDIAIAPFLSLGDGRLAASPWMLAHSSFERNFCAHAARKYPECYHRSDGPLAKHLAVELVDVFKKAGFEATHSVNYDTDEVKGDIDLLVWSKQESYVMAIELYWKIASGDVMEVLHGEKTCSVKMREQLPKYEKVLSSDAGRLAARAFNLKIPPTINDWSCGMVVRGFVGTPRIDQFFLVPDSLLLKEVPRHRSLRDICHWAKTKPFLPKENRDFQMYLEKVISPSGINVEFWECQKDRH